jgi:hypothetical protein
MMVEFCKRLTELGKDAPFRQKLVLFQKSFFFLKKDGRILQNDDRIGQKMLLFNWRWTKREKGCSFANECRL